MGRPPPRWLVNERKGVSILSANIAARTRNPARSRGVRPDATAAGHHCRIWGKARHDSEVGGLRGRPVRGRAPS